MIRVMEPREFGALHYLVSRYMVAGGYKAVQNNRQHAIQPCCKNHMVMRVIDFLPFPGVPIQSTFSVNNIIGGNELHEQFRVYAIDNSIGEGRVLRIILTDCRVMECKHVFRDGEYWPQLDISCIGFYNDHG